MNPASYYLSGVESYPDYVPTPIQIGGQIWDQKNLSTARYRDGAAIPTSGSFVTTQIGLWRYYGNSSAIGAIYGRLYNWYAMVGIWNFASIGDPSLRKNIAPLGWRAATEADWNQLASYLTTVSPAGNVGGKLKEAGTVNWLTPNTGATNSSLFTGLPGGTKSGTDGSYSNLTLVGNFWAYNSSQPRGRNLNYNSSDLTTPTIANYQPGRSIRLIKEDITVPGFTVSTSNINKYTATGTGIFGDVPNTPDFIEKGICWSTSSNPNIFADPYIVDGSTTKTTYSLTMSTLLPNTTYYARAYIKVTANDIRYSTNAAQFTTLVTNILNVLPAYHAYSLRVVSQDYSGYCLRVRRVISGVSAYADLKFNGTSLNSTISMSSVVVPVSGTTATTLGQFAAATGFSNPDGVAANQTIYVSTWYDQSGKEKHLVQTIQGNSPIIISSGNLEVKDGSVALKFTSASSQFLDLSDTAVPYNNVSCYVVSNSLSATTNTSAYGLGHNLANARMFIPRDSSISYNTANIFPISGITANVDRLYELICGTTTTSAYSNGVISSVPSTASISVTNTYVRIGSNSSLPSFYMNGHIKEAIGFIGTTNRTTIETNINTYYSIW